MTFAVRIKGARTSVNDCVEWFLSNPHLQHHVRHVDFWVPVWEQRPVSESQGRVALFPPQSPTTPFQGLQGLLLPYLPSIERAQPITSCYRLSSQSSSLDELFGTVQNVFPDARILTIEGGNCKKPPKIEQFRDKNADRALPKLPQIRTLVLKGAWNMIRDDIDFAIITSALPRLQDWQCMYATPKTKPYVAMYKVLEIFPSTITHLHLCMEGYYSRKVLTPAKTTELRERHHLCKNLGAILPQLEALTLSGRICGELFTKAISAAGKSRQARLKTLDLVVRNCCRDASTAWNGGVGIYNWGFIKAFEALVVGAVTALKPYKELKSMRIRFVDLDAPHAHMNPFFQLQDNQASGLWSEPIVTSLAESRPDTVVEMDEGAPKFGLRSAWRLKSLKVSDYAGFGEGLGI